MNQIQRNQLMSGAYARSEAGKKLEKRLRRLLWAAYIFLFIIVPIVAFALK